MTALVTLQEIQAAAARLPDVVRRTPLLPLARDAGEIGDESLFLKAENLQTTGAYKLRAAFTYLDSLDADQRRRGVVLQSSGNFAQAFAFAGRLMAVPVTVVMLRTTSPTKVEQTRSHGAEVALIDDPLERATAVDRIAGERGAVAVDSWSDRRIIAGHGTIGLEIVEQRPDVQTVLVPVSSGGLAAGVAAAVRLTRPEVRVIGIQPDHANAAFLSLAAGEPVTISHWNSIADGLSARYPGALPFRHLQEYLERIVLISEGDIGRAYGVLRDRAKLVAEPAGAVATAGWLSGKAEAAAGPLGRTVAIVSGGNLTHETMARLDALARSP
ncbi:MAG: threonine/serine dehydratase [Alphaproteobacteria bacterium]